MATNKVEFDREGYFISIVYYGPISLDDVEAVREEALRLSKKHFCYKLLTDFREASFDLSTTDIMDLPDSTAKVYSEHGMSAGQVKRALVVGKKSLSLSFLETVSLNRGQLVKIFKDINQAKSWLLMDHRMQPAKTESIGKDKDLQKYK
ncbi:MAG: hypothetical protein CMQ38_05895 [Gammaproteobacteria bacterium]|nr:hypothetical protein [Gammaproteobacteria bacterium]|tara:strand:+ start:186 stop:632 length:447 start_codon:yes stop_codon:yes gene_type:complete